MALQRVMQQHDQGCFIACVAMLNSITYNEAFRLIHPNKNTPQFLVPWWRAGLPPDKSIYRLMRLGMKPKLSKLKYLKSLKRNALIIMRWVPNEPIMHGIVYDAEQNVFLDPDISGPRPIKVYQKRVEQMYYITPLSRERINEHLQKEVSHQRIDPQGDALRIQHELQDAIFQLSC